MPQFASFSVSDGQTTPVVHTFNPASLDQSQNLAVFADRAGGIALGFNQVTLQLRPPVPLNAKQSTSERVYKMGVGMSLPLLETLGNSSAGYPPPPTIAYTMRFRGEFFLPERAVLLDRKNLRVMVADLFSKNPFQSMIDNLETIY